MKQPNNKYVVNLIAAPGYNNKRAVKKEFTSADKAMSFCNRVYTGRKPSQSNFPGSWLVAMEKRNPWYAVHLMKVCNITNTKKLMTVEDLLYIHIKR